MKFLFNKMENAAKKILKLFGSFLDKLSSRVGVGGLEISDSHLRFLRIDGGKFISASLRLPPGIISEGKLLNRNFLLEALKSLKRQLKVKQQAVFPVIVSLPAASVFTQSFSIPEVDDEQLKEAAGLNLQMISPIEHLETAYYHWQKIGLRNHQQNQVDILGAFVNRALVDDLYGVLRETGFYPSAFEFPALAIARLFKNFVNTAGVCIIIQLTSDGLDLMIVQDGNLYFNYFHSWKAVQGESRQIKSEDLQNILIQEIQKVINFASTHFSQKLNGVFLVSYGMEREIGSLIESRFGFKTIPLLLARFPSLGTAWFGVLGSALRGLIPRAHDDLISLARTDAEQEYYRYQTLAFIGLWRSIFAVFLGFLVIAFGGVDLFFRNINGNLDKQLASVVAQPEAQAIGLLREEASQFNKLVNLVKQTKSGSQKWNPFLAKLFQLGGDKVFFDRVLVQSLTVPVTVQARAGSERLAIEFKNKIISQPQFSEVNLPLSAITPVSAEEVSFNMTFKINSLNF